MTTPQDKISHATLTLQSCASTFRRAELYYIQSLPPDFEKAKHNSYMADLCENAIKFLEVDDMNSQLNIARERQTISGGYEDHEKMKG
jgi:hypothetical protein